MTWTNPPSNFKKTVRGDLNKTAVRVGLKILRILTVISPVNTGRFKANWIVGIKTRLTSTSEDTDKGGGPTLAKGSAKMKGKKLGDNIYITNNLPYAKALNDGHSTQAPANFVQSAIRRVLR